MTGETTDYNPHDYPPVAVAIDVVAVTIRNHTPHLLLVRRGEEPYKNMWALPGGFIQPDEDLPHAAIRELNEETMIEVTPYLEQLGTYGAPDRDPRMRVVSIAYIAVAADLPDPVAGTDAADAAWIPWAKLGSEATGDTEIPLAFDHANIIEDAIERVRAKLEYTPIATKFLPPLFTMAQLRAVYEAVWDRKLHPANFHRKVSSVADFVTDADNVTETGGDRGGRRARLYRAGTALGLHPALLRPESTQP